MRFYTGIPGAKELRGYFQTPSLSMRYIIQFYELEYYYVILREFNLEFGGVKAAIEFAESLVIPGQGYKITGLDPENKNP